MLDPGTVKLEFRSYDKPKYIEIEPGEKVLLACVMYTLELKPHIEIIEAGAGTFEITARKRENPKKIWFECKCLEYKVPETIGRYD